jgi:hypothetical protein
MKLDSFLHKSDFNKSLKFGIFCKLLKTGRIGLFSLK